VDAADLVDVQIAQGILVDGDRVGQNVGLGGREALHWSFLPGPGRIGAGERSALHRAPYGSCRDGQI
jgi:hypothetical protein